MNLPIYEACDADWSQVCEKEKIVSLRRMIRLGLLLKEMRRTDEQ